MEDETYPQPNEISLTLRKINQISAKEDRTLAETRRAIFLIETQLKYLKELVDYK